MTWEYAIRKPHEDWFYQQESFVALLNERADLIAEGLMDRTYFRRSNGGTWQWFDPERASASDDPHPIWLDRQGDIWTLGDDGLLHTPETRPFARWYVEKKWGPLVPTSSDAGES